MNEERNMLVVFCDTDILLRLTKSQRRPINFRNNDFNFRLECAYI